MTDLVLPADDVAQLDLAASKVRHALDSLQATAADDLSLSGKVPKKAFHAFATAQEGRVAVAEHITALQQALLPTSTAIVTAAVAYLQHVAQDSDAFAALAKSGQLSKQCTLIANALQCAQQGYEALGTDMLELQRALQQAKKKVRVLQAAAFAVQQLGLLLS
jgi:phage shock protein A